MRELAVSAVAVKTHMTAIMRKLGINNRTLIVLADNQFDVEPGAMQPLPGHDSD